MEMIKTDLIEKNLHAEKYIQTISEKWVENHVLTVLSTVRLNIRGTEDEQMFPKRRVKYTEDNCKQRHKRFLEKRRINVTHICAGMI